MCDSLAYFFCLFCSCLQRLFIIRQITPVSRRLYKQRSSSSFWWLRVHFGSNGSTIIALQVSFSWQRLSENLNGWQSGTRAASWCKFELYWIKFLILFISKCSFILRRLRLITNPLITIPLSHIATKVEISSNPLWMHHQKMRSFSVTIRRIDSHIFSQINL